MANPNDKLLDEILMELWNIDPYFVPYTKALPIAKQAILYNFVSKDKVREALKDEDEAEPDRRYDDPENHPPLQNQEAYIKNQARAEARSKLGIEEKGGKDV